MQLSLFTNPSAIRTGFHSDGRPVINIKDFADSRGINDHRALLRAIPDSERCDIECHTPGGMQLMVYGTKEGLLDVVLNGRKPVSRALRSALAKVPGTFDLVFGPGGNPPPPLLEQGTREHEAACRQALMLSRQAREEAEWRAWQAANPFFVKYCESGELYTREEQLGLWALAPTLTGLTRLGVDVWDVYRKCLVPEHEGWKQSWEWAAEIGMSAGTWANHARRLDNGPPVMTQRRVRNSVQASNTGRRRIWSPETHAMVVAAARRPQISEGGVS